MKFPYTVSDLLIPALLIIFTSCIEKKEVSLPPDKPFQWQIASPESQGFSGKALTALKDSLSQRGTKKLLIIRNDTIIEEWYANGFDDTTRCHYTASLAKALVGGMSLLLGMQDGFLDIDAPVCKYIPSWKEDPQKAMITFRHLATHSSGIEDAELTATERDSILRAGTTRTDHHMTLPGWKGAFWRKEPDPFTIARDQAPVIFTPGTDYAYSNPGMAMLAYAVTTCLPDTSQKNIRALLQERIMVPIGIEQDEWSIGYGNTYEVDDLELVPNWGGGCFTARATARVGRLMLHQGNWQGRQLIDTAKVEAMTRYAGTPLPARTAEDPVPGSGLCWYTNFDGVFKSLPRDAFMGAGAGNQILLVIPSLQLIVVRYGDDLFGNNEEATFWGSVEHHLFYPLMQALIASPYPKSDDILEAKFDPVSSIQRSAEGSDNWPTTWADDDHLYTAYGDGWGFEPLTDIKLSLGIAKITGFPPDFQGVNIRTEGERVGQGVNGPKASGLLMVDGVLYMLVRNTSNAQLAWSDDHGTTWNWADWKFTESFGCPTFLNFGKNYQDARDRYVYIYSQDTEDAYTPADRMVLARVPKDHLKNWKAYEYFAGFDTSGDPQWTEDIRKRRAVFTNPAQCYRSGISYNTGLGKYLWCQIIAGEDTRFAGGLGIYESDEPWGPWKTVYYTRDWDVGPGETCHFPTKWMSKDGKTCYLVFSGDDYFSVRQVEFTVK